MELGRKGYRRVWCSGLGASVILSFAAFSVHSQNLVNNGNFEAGGGSFDGWTISHSASMPDYSGPAIATGGDNDPYYARFTFETGGNDTLFQEISTMPGDLYDISFYAEDGDGHNFGTSVDFGNVSEDLGPSFSTGPGQWYAGWTNFNFDVMAAAFETDLAFIIAADTGSEFGVDDISVTPVPRMQSGIVNGKFKLSVTNCSAQVVIQASADMVNWVTVCTNMAPCSYTDACAMPRCFFRAAVLVQTNAPQ